MSQDREVSYLNNFNYRENILINEEDHKLFQAFPYKQRDCEVQSISYYQTSRRDLSANNEEKNQENTQDNTILQALDEAERQKCQNILQQQVDKSQNKNFQKQSQKILQSQKLIILNTDTNIKDLVYKKEQTSKLMNILKLLVNIQHFFRILSMNSRIFNKLTQHQHYLISDISSSYTKNSKLKKGYKKFNLFNNSLYFLIELIHKLDKYVFTPQSNLIKAWDILQSLLIIFSTFLLNLELFFAMNISSFQLLFQVIFIISIIDIFVGFNTGVLKKGNIIMERNFIIKSFIKNRFFFILIGNIPLFFYISKVEVSTSMRVLINIFYAFKWIKVSDVLKQVAFYVCYEKDHKNIFDLLKLLIFVVGICHIFCLFWHGLVMFEINNGITNNWLESKSLLDASIQDRYIYSFYFLAVTMATVGYGDISPQNKFEVLFTTVTIFVTCIVYAFSLNTIGAIIENIEKKDKKYKENLQIIHALMREEEVSRNLKIKISDYIEYLYKESNEIQRKQEKLIIEKLSTKLRNDLNLEIQGKYLSNIPLFKCIKEKDKVAKIMEEQLYSPSEIIFTQGDIDDCSLYYIVKGSVSIVFESGQNSNREAKQIEFKENKQYFGEISFITGNPRTYTAKATDFCKIFKINREQFLSVIKQHDQDYENFQMIKEAVTFSNNFKFCSMFCSTCQSGKHFSMHCPRTHLTFTKQIIISRYNSSSPQERASCNRKNTKKNYIQKKMQLQQAVLQINNVESLSEIIDFIENGSYYQDQIENDANCKQEIQLGSERGIRLRNNTLSSNLITTKNENFGSQLETIRKAQKSIESQQERTIDYLKRQSKSYLNQQNNLQLTFDQNNQAQKQTKKSFLYSASQNQQFIQELQKQELIDIKQNSSTNNDELQPQSQSSISSLTSQNEKTNSIDSSLSIENKIENNSKQKKSFLTPNSLEDKQNQNQIAFEQKEELLMQKRYSQISQRRQSNKNNTSKLINNSSKNIILNSDVNDQQLQYNRYNDKQKNNNSQQNDRATNLIFLAKEPNQLENNQNAIQYNTSKITEGQMTKISNFQISAEPLTLKQFQQRSSNNSLIYLPQLSLKNSQNQLSFQNEQKATQGTNSLSSGQFSKHNLIGVLQSDKKMYDVTESSDQVNYLMLQIFDKAKIYNYYQNQQIKKTKDLFLIFKWNMSQDRGVSYLNNLNYRENILLNEEDHKFFQAFPYKQRDSEVQSVSYSQTSRRDLSANNEEKIQENTQDNTILQAIDEAQRQQYHSVLQQQENSIKYFQKQTLKKLQTQKLVIINTDVNIKDLAYKNEQTSKLMNILKLLVNIQHFFRILSMNSRIFNKLTQHQHYLISDISSSYTKNFNLKKGNNKFNIFNNSLYFLIDLIHKLDKYVFTPQNNLIKAWDTLQSLLIIFSTFLLNLELFFGMNISNFQLLFQVIFIVSIIDILVGFNTGVLKKGNIITERNFIIKSYIKNRLFFSLIGNIPLFFYISKVEVSTTMRILVNIFYAFKWNKVSDVLKQIAFYVSYEKDHKNIFDLLKLLIFVIGICHIFCLFWHGLVMFEINNGITNNWLESKNLLNASIQERYIYSFYFLAVTMATVGYGDISPQNQFEVLFTTVTIFVTCIVYAFSLNTIGAIIENIEKKDKKYKENLQIIHALMREEEVSRNLKIKISDYIKYLYKESNEIQRKQEKLIIEKLSAKLRNDLNLEIQGKYLSNIPLFKYFKEKDKVAKIMEEQLYSPSEIIFTQGDIDDCSLYYIVKGSVSIIFESGQNLNREAIQIELKQNKQYFGEISFITGNPRTYTAKATDFCKIFKINRQSFLSVIKEHDQDYENFQMIKEAITFSNNFKFCSMFCSTCKSGKHLSMHCPRTHLTFTKQIIISRYNSSSPQERASYNRKHTKKNYLQKKMQLQQAVLQINNVESLSEIIDFIENGSYYQDQFDNEANYKQEIQLGSERGIRLRNNTHSSNFISTKNDNFGSQLDTIRKAQKSMENQQEKTIDYLKIQRKSYLNQQNNQQLNVDQNNQTQKQTKKSFLYSASQNQQFIQELQKCEQVDIKQNSSMNNDELQPQSQPSISSLTSQNERNDSIDSSLSIENKIENNPKQKKSFLIPNYLEDKYFVDKQKNNNQQNDRSINLILLAKEPNQLENNQTTIQFNTSKITEGQITKFNNFQIPAELLTLKQFQQLSSNYSLQNLSQLSLKNSQNQYSLQNEQKVNQGTNSQSSGQFSKHNQIGILQSDKKIDDITESSDQVNYLMLQIFDKAKIYKYYQPHFNYTEIVQKWIKNNQKINPILNQFQMNDISMNELVITKN
ncbi:cation channel family protein (macronuclear) [Tetrahymena thermophila SB210]|uniref:Cation channel family protein n=1 Tax=Tetrahymena thermophila (strain SB210) TaxID=312017 RepID=Q22TN2_TETTS|nr:cation channel family protein [Tetrahymena thermophila SB210]EAR88406.2 cation channel family protein [Tetrahymena thermophila SB210]|eukprot:XP_001008651.2 cation channel family protein [Tetrahymena thermophila SB210]